MFRRPTVLVVGAGASFEAGMPMGGELLSKLASALNIRFNDASYLDSGDLYIDETLRGYCNALCRGDQRMGFGMVQSYREAGWRIAEAAREGLSIDAIIDHHENDKIEFMGKLGITWEILKAEAASKLRCPPGRRDELDLDGCKDSWLPRLGRLIVEGRKIGSLNEAFANLTIITFNYDRCIEHYLPFSLVSHYGIPLPEARELVAKLRIFHPFGTVGRLLWQVGTGPAVEFGADRANLVAVSQQIKTFTEQLKDVATLDAMRAAMREAERIVFLGFAYHRPNLALIKSGDTNRRMRDIFGTVKGISERDRRVIELELGAALDIAANRIDLLDVTCSQLFDENWRTLTS